MRSRKYSPVFEPKSRFPSVLPSPPAHPPWRQGAHYEGVGGFRTTGFDGAEELQRSGEIFGIKPSADPESSGGRAFDMGSKRAREDQ